MLELINRQTQDVAIADTIALGSTAIGDPTNRMYLADGDSIKISQPGKYKISAIFNIANTTASAVNGTIELYANSAAIGLPITTTVPANGYAEIVLEKTVRVYANTAGSIASVQFITPTGVTVSGCQVDIYKRS